LFGLFQGGIVPMYAIIVREYFSPAETGTRLGIVLLATLLGMALGGWMSGRDFRSDGQFIVRPSSTGSPGTCSTSGIVAWLLPAAGPAACAGVRAVARIGQ